MTSVKLKNLAIVAHVDHGKTTLMDGLLRDAGALSGRGVQEDRVMDSGELEKERGITIRAKNCSLYWKDYKINLMDTPGHADFGGEVERSLMMVDGVFLLVDAAEGPLPQTRFVLQKAMEKKIKISVVINKVDRPDERIDEVMQEIEDLLLELATLTDNEDFDLNFPVVYASAKQGWASMEKGVKTDNLSCILDLMVADYYPTPRIEEGDLLRFLVCNLTYSPYLGRQMIGRIQRGKVRKNGQYVWCGDNNKRKNFKVTSVQVFDTLGQKEVDEAGAGEIVIISGMDEAFIGDGVCSPEDVNPLPRIAVDPPTVAVHVSVNTSPMSGREGEYLTSRKLEEMLESACQHNVSLQFTPTDDPKMFLFKGRGELQLAVVFEEWRRMGYEFMVSRPEVIEKKTDDGKTLVPFEQLVVDVPTDYTGAVTEAISQRKGIMNNMAPLGDTRTRIEFVIPSHGLIGFRSGFLNVTRGEGLMSSYFLEYREFPGKKLGRQNGAIISDRTGKTTGYALFNLLNSGKQFINVGEEVYEGMVVGEHTRTNDLNVNVCREKHVSSVRTAGKDENIILPPIPDRSLDWAIDWIDDDEWVEVTPKNIRIRKKELVQKKRSVIR